MSLKCKVEVCVASGSHTIGKVHILHVLQRGLVGHSVTKPKLLEE